MKLLVVGGGGREHALVWKLAQSELVKKIYCAPGNAGTAQLAGVAPLSENIPIGADDIEALLEFVKKESIDFTVVGPEVPLVKGIVDLFKENGQKIFGPSKEASRLEGSKSFMKDVLKKAGIPTAGYETFTDAASAEKYINSLAEWRHVVKADGLAAGKGVLVTDNKTEALKFSADAMAGASFGDAGSKIIVEDFLSGEEASYIVVADGENFVAMASSQDHKRAFDGDKGPNTGGMGAYSPAPVITAEVEEKIKRKVIEPLLREMSLRGAPFTGFLYAGLMIDNGEPTVLEFNVRMGDPETQPLLVRYGGDLLELLMAAERGDVTGVNVEWQDDASVCIVMASGGYPGSYEKGKLIAGLGNCADNVVVFHAGTKLDGKDVVTSGGRVLGVTASAPTVKEAVDAAYACCEKISWEDSFYRKDIAKRAINR